MEQTTWITHYDENKKAELILSHKQRIENILMYFQDRPEDLLVIDICGGEGWEKLCPFLDLPTRNDLFTHANITTNIERQSFNKWKRTFKRALRKLVK